MMPGQAEAQTLGPHTWSDYIGLAEDDPRELLDGRFVELEVPSKTHERIVAMVIALLWNWCWSRNAGQVFASGYKVKVDEHRGVMPDVQLYLEDNLPDGQEEGLERGRPDLVVEVISPTSRSKDSVRKLRDYASIGVPEYWMIDPEARTLERLVLRDGVYGIVEALDQDAVFRPQSLPGLEVPLRRLWERLSQAKPG